MTVQSPFRFGVVVNQMPSRGELEETARRVEAMGYATLLFGDHFGDRNAIAPSVMVAAECTTSLRLGTYVYANDFRNPVVLAKEVTTLDAFTGGRFELGIGSGWQRSDYIGSGISFDPGPVRVARLREAVHVLKALFADGFISFDGDFYHLRDQEGLPKPVQRPHPPILVGGGAPSLLRWAIREADIVSVNPRHRGGALGECGELTRSSVEAKVAVMREAAGEALAEREINVSLRGVTITDDRRVAADRIGHRLGLPAAEVLDTPYVVVGTVEKAVADLLRWREEMGISYYVVVPLHVDRFAPVVERLAGR